VHLPDAASWAVATAVPTPMSSVATKGPRASRSRRSTSPTVSVTNGDAAFIMLMKATVGHFEREWGRKLENLNVLTVH
jgi:hypothetical protein